MESIFIKSLHSLTVTTDQEKSRLDILPHLQFEMEDNCRLFPNQQESHPKEK